MYRQGWLPAATGHRRIPSPRGIEAIPQHSAYRTFCCLEKSLVIQHEVILDLGTVGCDNLQDGYGVQVTCYPYLH